MIRMERLGTLALIAVVAIVCLSVILPAVLDAVEQIRSGLG